MVMAAKFPLPTARFGRIEVNLLNQGQRGSLGIANGGGIIRVQNTIIAGNIQGPLATAPLDCSGTITSLGNNLIGDPTGCDINLQPSDLTGDPGLGSLVENGEDDAPGRAFYPVLAGSVVINRANPAGCLKTDQLGNPRIGICDIGSVEFQEKMLVSVDVRPRREANKINPNSTKNINVAISVSMGLTQLPLIRTPSVLARQALRRLP